MTWLAWRRFRAQARAALALLVIAAAAAAITGPHLARLYDLSLAGCTANCGATRNLFLLTDSGLRTALSDLVIAAPGLTGILWGAPLVARELENGTYRLAWTQSVTRTRWLITKLAVAGLASLALTGLLSLIATWWADPLDTAGASMFTPAVFQARGIVPVGYAAFGLVLGVTAGMIIRRTIPAMAATLMAFTGVRLAIADWARPRFLPPLHQITDDTALAPGPHTAASGAFDPRNWVIGNQTINAAGRVIGQDGFVGSSGNPAGFGSPPSGRLASGPGGSGRPAPGLGGSGRIAPGLRGSGSHAVTIHGVGTCPNIRVSAPAPGAGGNPLAAAAAIQKCVRQLGIRELFTYQPVGRYWPFQLYELGIFLVLTLMLAGICVWWVRHRLC